MAEDEITGVEETDASESSTEEQDLEETTESEEEEVVYDDLTGDEEDEPEIEEEIENKVPQNRFSKVVEERNAERERAAKLEKELELFKGLIPSRGNNEPVDETPKGIDYSKYMNEDGELDLNSYSRDLAAQIRNEVKGEIKQEMTYDRMATQEWDDAVSAYPELRENPRLANLVKASRTQSLIDGKFVKYVDVADEIFAEFGKVREAGAESIRTSERIQKKAGSVEMGSGEQRTSKGTLTNADIEKMGLNEYAKAKADGSIERAIKAGTLKGFMIK